MVKVSSHKVRKESDNGSEVKWVERNFTSELTKAKKPLRN